MLKQAGFAASEFLGPFPDYKLPVSIITEEGYSNRQFDAAAFAWQSARRDPQLSPISNFSLELVWPTVFDNQLALDLANSFLVVASPQVQTLVDEGVLAYHYSTDRRPEFCKEAVFKRDETGEVCIKYNRLASINNGQSNNPYINFVCPDLDNYSLGKPLSLELLKLVTRDGWSIDEVALFIKRYLSFLGKIYHETYPKLNLDSPFAELPGECFDATPQNIIIGKDGSVSLIDKEWQLACPIEVGHLLFRSLLLLLNSITRFGRPVYQATMTRYQFIDGVLAAAGLKVQEEDYIRYIKLEANIQESVTGRALVNVLDWAKDQPIPILNMNQVVTARDSELAARAQDLIRSQGRVGELEQSTSWRITKPLRRVADFLKRVRSRAGAARRLWRRALASLPMVWRILRTEGPVALARRIRNKLNAPCYVAPRRPAPALSPIGPLALATCAEGVVPRYSIVIPVYEQHLYTFNCLKSLGEHTDLSDVEIIVVDDASPTEAAGALANLTGVRLVRNAENLGFIGSCHHGADLARGQMLVMLNNDTQVTIGRATPTFVRPTTAQARVWPFGGTTGWRWAALTARTNRPTTKTPTWRFACVRQASGCITNHSAPSFISKVSARAPTKPRVSNAIRWSTARFSRIAGSPRCNRTA
jgi:hypothetical protein